MTQLSKAAGDRIAVALVTEYAALQDHIDGCRKRIGECLNKCAGLKGFRLEVVQHPGGGDGEWAYEAFEAPSERAEDDQDVHLKEWYTHDEGGFIDIGADEQAQCPHCYAAHLVVQERKRAKKQLGSVKGRMRKLGRKWVTAEGFTGESRHQWVV